MGTSDQDRRDEDAALKARLEKLGGALDARRSGSGGGLQDGSGKASSGMATGKAMAAGFRVVSELVAGVLVGGVIGWWVDKLLGSSPIALLAFLALGTISGFWNVYRVAARPTGLSADDKNGHAP